MWFSVPLYVVMLIISYWVWVICYTLQTFEIKDVQMPFNSLLVSIKVQPFHYKYGNRGNIN